MRFKNYNEVQEEIGKLQGMREDVREFSLFGDNNRDAIDAQIEVLEKSMSEADIYDRSEDESGDWNQHIFESALFAHHWRTGDSEVEDGSPSDTWQSLVGE